MVVSTGNKEPRIAASDTQIPLEICPYRLQNLKKISACGGQFSKAVSLALLVAAKISFEALCKDSPPQAEILSLSRAYVLDF